ncbi:MAG: hypothetical protein KGO50_04495, partial [Myxococcales bacterium]|nr:hypothetical protein [Myxococcales bacterium]
MRAWPRDPSPAQLRLPTVRRVVIERSQRVVGAPFEDVAVQVLAIGLKEQENEELERWQETRGFKVWVAATALAGLRV